jgi:capsular polysaccharide export protein
VTSQVGFEALIWGKKVKCFGMPFYAGWGLTEDVLPAPKRRKSISLEQLIYAALVKYPIYRDPETYEVTTVEKTIKYIGFQRQMRFRFPETLYAYGFTPWKKSILKFFTQGSELVFTKHLEDVPIASTLLVWGSQNCDGLDESVNLIRVEDGFLRSVGLGGDLIQPQSWAFDNEGIYYDSSKPSQLETILNNTEFKSEELVRAKQLIEKLFEHRISKYNLGDSELEIKNGGKTTILVVGQVEKDASIRFGTGEVNTNLKLLKAVREKFPAAYILYKPHPDVVVGIRRKGESESLEKNYYDHKVESGDALALFDAVDSVHTMTSLVGFEALLRNKKVYTYGQPFYSGWGLTIDTMPNERRNRQLNLEELVTGSLIRYPTYISSTSKMYTSPERTVEELIQQKEKGVQRMPLWRKFVRDLIKIWTHSKLRPNA